MSYKPRFGRSAAAIVMESTAGTVVEGELLDADQQHGDGADAALLEVQADVAQMDKNDAAVVDLENTVVALESLLEGAEASLETGGLDANAADMLARAVNNETAPLGTPADEVVPALESFSSSTDRRQATIMACEGIGTWIETAWKKIKELIARGREFFKGLWVKLKQAVGGLQRRVAGLQKDLEARNEAAKKSGQVELADGKWNVKDLASANTVITSVLKDYTESAVGYAEAVATSLGAGQEEKLAAMTEEARKKAEEAAAKKKFSVPKAVENSVTKIEGATLFGGYELVAEAVGFSIQSVGQENGKSKTYASAPMSFSDIKGHLKTLEDLAKAVIEYERGFQKRDDAARKVSDQGDKFAKEAKKNDQKDEGKVRDAINAAKDAAYLLDKPIRTTLSFAVAAINGSCGFLAAHIKHYDKK